MHRLKNQHIITFGVSIVLAFVLFPQLAQVIGIIAGLGFFLVIIMKYIAKDSVQDTKNDEKQSLEQEQENTYEQLTIPIEASNEQVLSYKCPACGGTIVFTANHIATRCSFCGAVLRWLINLKRNHPNYRTAVIVHSKKTITKEKLISVIQEKNVSWYAVDDKKLPLLTVENAKGLEFEAVVVLCKGMEINEQYIAFTRALDYLCVVKAEE